MVVSRQEISNNPQWYQFGKIPVYTENPRYCTETISFGEQPGNWSCGKIQPGKNHKKLLNIYKAALQKQQNVKLVLVGDGALKREIEEQAQKENLDVLFVGLSQVVEQWLQAMDVMVFPSLFEGLPLGLVEAQAAGLPCVLSDTISPMSKVTDDVTFLKLNDTDQNWADVALHMAKSAERGLKNEKIQKAIAGC